ncbi:TIGR04104 family putative zinc finger protein [Salsuginibacillus kocurii]|uniref:TIGR04104 family putative zinc finger protein n=1 Tax=Salsuginibacillus kocurii TaxID=427078 RepID=UPI000368D48E|nr:TIGR04104 family putative zinc finger protein [Salsuginibacillus kocurii]
MKLPRCWKCAHIFSWKQAFRHRDGETTCPVCGSVQYLQQTARWRSNFVPLIGVVLILALINIEEVSGLSYWLAVVGTFAVSLFAYPFCYRFTEQKEDLF